MKPDDTYHHGHLREELLRLGLEALETEGADKLSLRSLAERAGVSKAAPYRHFKDRELFLGALADEGFHLLCLELERTEGPGPARVASMGKAYMGFAVAHPALYRLMNSPLVCSMPAGMTSWARKSLMLLAQTLAMNLPGSLQSTLPDINSAIAAWSYIHGLVLIRIDKLFPADLGEPDWERLAMIIPLVK